MQGERDPYVWIKLPLAASSGGPFCLVCLSSPVAVTTLTSAPLLTRNGCLEIASQMKRRPLLLRPVAAAVTGNRHCRFHARSEVASTVGLPFQTGGGRNTNDCRGEEWESWTWPLSARREGRNVGLGRTPCLGRSRDVGSLG